MSDGGPVSGRPASADERGLRDGPGAPDASWRPGVLGWFVRNRVVANLLLFGISLAGLLTLGGVPQELLPEPPASALTVRSVFPGAGAELIEQSVLIPIEETLRQVSGIREIGGFATSGLGVVTVRLEGWADFQAVNDEIREQVGSLQNLPRDAEDPVVAEIPPARRLLRIGVHGNADERSLFEAARQVADAVGRTPGVATAEIVSGRDYEIAIEVSARVLTRFGLTIDQVAQAIRRGSADIPGGAIRSAAGELRVSTDAEAATAADYARLPLIATPDGAVLRVEDIATVTDGFADVARTARMNGESAVFVEVRSAEGARLIETARAVHAVVRRLDAELPPGLSVTTWYNVWENFESRIDLLVRNGLQGLALIFLVLFFTLSSRLAVWTAAGLPVAFFGACLMMPGLGVTINMFSLFGFILTLGLVVDDAIVVGENVQRRISLAKTGAEAAAAVKGVRQVLVPATFGVLTTIAAFVPLLGLPGGVGELMAPVPLIVLPVLAFSLLDAAWILPHHMVHGGLPVRPSRRLAWIRARFQSGLDWTVDTAYRPALRWALHNRLTTVSLAVASLLFATSLVGGGWVLFESMPPVDGSLVTVQVTLPPGSSASATAEVVGEVESEIVRLREEIRDEHGVEVQRSLASLVGQRLPFGPGGRTLGGVDAGSGETLGQVTLELLPPDQQVGVTAGEVADRLRYPLRELSHGGEAVILTSLLGEEADMTFRISGDDLEELHRASAALRSRIQEYSGVIATRDDLEGRAPALVARTRATGAGVGVGAADFGRQLRQAFHGEEIQRIQRGPHELRVLLRYPQSERENPVAVTGMRVRRTDGGVTSLGSVAEVSREQTLSVIRRVDTRRAVHVHGDVDPAVASAGAIVREVENRTFLDLREQFPDLRFEVGGAAEGAQETLAVLQRNLWFTLMLIYGLLAIPLASWTQPFVIMAAVPFGLAGAVFGHGVMGLPLSTMSIMGMVPLTGIVVNDSLVLLHFIKQNRHRGMTAFDAALAAGPMRFRPIILTTVTTCAGLAPLLFERSLQAAFLIPLAVSLAFGVAFATSVTLLIVPVLHSLAGDFFGWFRR